MINPALAQLKDIHLPPPISFWPIAPGWILLYFLTCLALGFAVFKWRELKKRHLIINYALTQLTELQTLAQHNPQNVYIAAEISTLIRRTALHYFPRAAIAGLSGQQWLTFLNESGRTTQFTDQVGQLLLDAPYRKQQADLTPLFSLVRQWFITIGKERVQHV